MTNSASLETRIRQLEDLEAIRSLTALYARSVDKGWNGKAVDFDGLRMLFTPNANWRCAAMGVDVTGQDAIIAMLREATGAPFAMHSFTNPIIEINGDRATATWLLWVAINTGTSADEVFQSEDLVYQRTAHGWQIAAIDLHFGQMLKS